MAYTFQSWPKVTRSVTAIPKLSGDALGCDLEWNVRTGEPTVLGLSDGNLTISVPWGQGEPYLRDLVTSRPDVKWVGHNFISADLQVLNKLGIHIRPEQVEDTII